jgi:2'-5' RNA ligase
VSAIGRAFVAVVPPPEVLDALEAQLALAKEGSGLRWMRQDQLHFTLQFLGRVHDADGVTAALEREVSSVESFTARLKGCGAFPSVRRARIVWIGVDEGTEGMRTLADRVHAATEPFGHEREDRAYTPHLTVARASRQHAVQAVLSRVGDDAIGPEWRVGEVVLFESDTRPDGAVHTERQRFALGRTEIA